MYSTNKQQTQKQKEPRIATARVYILFYCCCCWPIVLADGNVATSEPVSPPCPSPQLSAVRTAWTLASLLPHAYCPPFPLLSQACNRGLSGSQTDKQASCVHLGLAFRFAPLPTLPPLGAPPLGRVYLAASRGRERERGRACAGAVRCRLV